MHVICNLIIFILLGTYSAEAKEAFLSADKITYNETGDYAEAIGNVKVIIDRYTIYADRVHYDLKNEEIFGEGNIRATVSGKEIVLGSSIIFNAHAKRALISSLVIYFKNNDSVMAAKFAEKLEEHHERLTKAVYTACPTCSNKKPLWALSAKQVDIYDDEYKIVYRSAFFEIYGIPVMYFPYFSHVKPGAPARSGILTPQIRRKRLGIPVYWRAKSNLDATFTPQFTSKAILYEGEVRHLLRNGKYKFNGSITNSKVGLSTSTLNETGSKTTVPQEDRYRRYNVSSAGDFTISHYHYGFNLNKVSDRGYLKEYYKRNEPFLLSNMYIFKTAKEDYFEVNNLHLQGLSSKDSKFTDPTVIPEINFRYVIPLEQLNDTNLSISNYSAVYNTETLGRVSRTIWSTSLYNSYNLKGQILGYELYNRSDLYKVELDNKKVYNTGRTIPEARLSWRYPWGGLVAGKVLIIEPIALAAFGKNHIPNASKFGLIDINNYDYSDTNFHHFNHYNGVDFHEYGKRVTYGMNSALNIRDGYRFSIFLGQFQKLSKAAEQRSNIVGRVSMNFLDQLEIYYRFKKAPNNLDSLFNEAGVWYNDQRFTADGGYVSAKNIELLNDQNKIAQTYFNGGYDVTDNWNIGLGVRFDVTSKPKRLSDSIRVTYKGDCVSISTTISNDYSVDSTRSIKKSRDYSLAIGLRTLSM